jgi:transitional endoplasmic reticulum ATPase
MDTLTRLHSAIQQRLRNPAWHLIWFVPLFAAVPLMRGNLAERVAPADALQSACKATAGCRAVETVFARRDDRSLSSIPSRILGGHLVVIDGSAQAVSLLRSRFIADSWLRGLAVNFTRREEIASTHVITGDWHAGMVRLPMTLIGLLWLPGLALTVLLRKQAPVSTAFAVVGAAALLLGLWQAVAQSFALPVYDGTVPLDLIATVLMAFAFLQGSQVGWHLSHPTASALWATPPPPRIPRGRPVETATAAAESEVIPSPVRPRSARLTFADVIGMDALKRQLLDAGTEILDPRKRSGTARNGILLHGAPGNGKTFFAEALAGELGLAFMEARIGEISSRWVGQSTEQLVAIFREAKRRAPVLLFLDEVDSILPDRAAITSADSETARLVNTILTETVDVRGRNVVLVAATNFLSRLDPAAIRDGRFDFKVEVAPPDEPARLGLLRHRLRSCRVDQTALTRYARRSTGFSVARLTAIAAEAARQASRQRTVVDHALLAAATRTVQGTRRSLPPDTPGLSALVLAPELRSALDGLATRMRDHERIERLGGTVPTGALFFGAPGTGKTAAVRALARDTGWTLIPTHGAELESDPQVIDRLIAEAEDLRPAIVFIDEADAIVGHRLGSGVQSITNAILIAMDRAQTRPADLLFVAATNHPEQVDPAALRRFTEKVVFDPPGEAERQDFARRWLAATAARVDPRLGAVQIAGALQGLTIALCIEAMKAAVNTMIARTGAQSGGQVTLQDVRAGRQRVVAG